MSGEPSIRMALFSTSPTATVAQKRQSTINGWAAWISSGPASQVIQAVYGSSSSANGPEMFLRCSLRLAFSLISLFSGRGYCRSRLTSIVWAHNTLRVAPAIQPRGVSINPGSRRWVAHYPGGIATHLGVLPWPDSSRSADVLLTFSTWNEISFV